MAERKGKEDISLWSEIEFSKDSVVSIIIIQLLEWRVSEEASQVVCYSHLFQNFPQFIVIHTVKGFGIVNKAEIDVFSGTLLPFP